ncbi:enoyl-CoA hydratase/isomerase family protein [Novosphingobium sp. KCTC 2891]|uniref:enoyl-CoA hydratase/isomerase family protein n=1 Tax=Novosphingobium sp. KCTC 2891 TaxID=2989730 RepID=UPI0022220B8E|nr:enoyl-CoA hydratase/isomerase family protein [Novosphingobium sp. KCTC 2891]MCW1383656.1 enoyl-CoA hydratase/isomerase family protein [Novosphingobium sp. KCTC 2891]
MTAPFALEAFSPLEGSPLVVVDLARSDPRPPPGGVRIALDRQGSLPMVDPSDFDAMVTTCPDAPAPWVWVAAPRLEAQLAVVGAAAAHAPVATSVLAQVLRLGVTLDVDTALDVESLAYSTLLGGGEFARWRAGTAVRTPAESTAPRDLVRYERTDDAVTLTLASPGNRNAMTAATRDALWEALANVLDDPTAPQVELRGEGRCFSTGGDLAEFGTAHDLAQAHVIRTRRSCARLLHRLGPRATARLHGLCIGSGIEVPAAAARRIAAPDTVVRLPELAMGLIPGAGGTVTLARAIGRHRLCWLVLGGFKVGAEQALRWGLVHAIEP